MTKQFSIDGRNYGLVYKRIEPFGHYMVVGDDFDKFCDYAASCHTHFGNNREADGYNDQEERQEPPLGLMAILPRHYGVFISPEATVLTIAHEALHVTHALCDDLGVPLTEENTEVQAYLQGHIMNLIVDALGLPSIDDPSAFDTLVD